MAVSASSLRATTATPGIESQTRERADLWADVIVLRQRSEEGRKALQLLVRPTGFPTLQTASQLPQPFPRKASSCPRRPRVVVGIIVAECGVPRWPVHPRIQETDGAGQMAGSQGSFRAIFDSARCKSTGSIGCNFSQLTSTSWRGRVLHFNESVSPTFADRAPDSASVPRAECAPDATFGKLSAKSGFCPSGARRGAAGAWD